MKSASLPLALATVASAMLAIAAAPWALNAPALAWCFKPLTTLLLIALAVGRGDTPAGVRRWLLAGLLASLAGDIALLWPREGFVPGLVSFLIAHLCYLRAFTREAPFVRAWPVAFVLYGVVAAGLLARLWPGVPGALHVPVIAYVLCLAAMAAQAAARAHVLQHPLAWRAAAGGALFVTSDALLAFDRFSAPLPAASFWILVTYWAAQACIVATLPLRSTDAAGSEPLAGPTATG